MAVLFTFTPNYRLYWKMLSLLLSLIQESELPTPSLLRPATPPYLGAIAFYQKPTIIHSLICFQSDPYVLPFVTIPISTLVQLLNGVVSDGPRVSRNKGIDRIREHCETFYEFFDFAKVRLGSCMGNLDQIDLTDDAPEQRRLIFINSISTDGFTVNVPFNRRAKKVSLPDLDMDDFKEDLINHQHLNDDFRLWAVDPGIKDIYCATDGQSEYRTISTKEWRAKCGITRRLSNQLCRKHDNGILQIESDMPICQQRKHRHQHNIRWPWYTS
ncbi:hypothetical protein BC941DRAFT_140240 [Chlamydoabsidia padenii]|nr:hypothetical protein BC941DRAFT_140240 [Chlamydoabsidia padenii]